MFLLAQLPFGLVDARSGNVCQACRNVIDSRPREVLFGFSFSPNGDIYFSMDNREWFKKIFKNASYGVSIDIISKERYACDRSNPEEIKLPMGKMLMPVYLPDLLKNEEKLNDQLVYTKIGTLPVSLRNKEIEGNLVIVNGNQICFYTNFVNIPRSDWDLLPMGYYTDTLLTGIDNSSFVSDLGYQKKINITIPFAKGSTVFTNDYLHKILDSAEISKFAIQKLEIRAYSSVEGTLQANTVLMNKRADAVLAAIETYQKITGGVTVITAENWIAFFRDIQNTAYQDFTSYTKQEVKTELLNSQTAKELEDILARERKVEAVIYVRKKTSFTRLENDSLVSKFNTSITKIEIDRAREYQKELAERVNDKRAPIEYLTKLEVPKSKVYADVASDHEVYKYLLKATTEYDALQNLLILQKTDPYNGHINYNISVLRFFLWENGDDTTVQNVLFKEINNLKKQGIEESLVKRMLINYYILKCQQQASVFDYTGEDKSIASIAEVLTGMKFTDEDLFSLAKYYSFYSDNERAMDLLSERVTQTDAIEDIVFYYLNLLLFYPSEYDTEEFQEVLLNAINLNPKRFCDLFRSGQQGGASMQLLEYDEIKSYYCESCK